MEGKGWGMEAGGVTEGTAREQLQNMLEDNHDIGHVLSKLSSSLEGVRPSCIAVSSVCIVPTPGVITLSLSYRWVVIIIYDII